MGDLVSKIMMRRRITMTTRMKRGGGEKRGEERSSIQGVTQQRLKLNVEMSKEEEEVTLLVKDC